MPLPGEVRGRQTFVNDGANRNVSESERAYNNWVNQTKHDYYVNRAKEQTAKNLASGYSGGGGGGGGSYTIQYEQPDYSAWFNTLAEISNQKYDALKKAFAQQKQRADELNNMNYARNLREWRKMYADRRNGQGLSNKLNINYDRDNTSRQINETFDTNNLNTIAGRYSDLSGLTSQLANMDSNTIKKIMAQVGSWTI